MGASFYFQNNHKYSYIFVGVYFVRFLRKVELDIWISGGSQGYIQCRPEDLGVMIFKFPEYGSLRWHGVLNQAWKCIFQKLEKIHLGGKTKIGSYYILPILYSWKWKMSHFQKMEPFSEAALAADWKWGCGGRSPPPAARTKFAKFVWLPIPAASSHEIGQHI